MALGTQAARPGAWGQRWDPPGDAHQLLPLFTTQELSSPEAWASYLRGPSAPLQFHGNSTLQVTGTSCPDKSGCACGNTPVSPPIAI